MAEQTGVAGRQRRKKYLTTEQKCELWTAMVQGDATQRELADRWGVDRSTVVKISQVAKHGALPTLAASKPGKPGAHDPREHQLRQAQEEIARLTEAVKEQAIELAMLPNPHLPCRPLTSSWLSAVSMTSSPPLELY